MASVSRVRRRGHFHVGRSDLAAQAPGLKDVITYAKLIQGLILRGYSEARRLPFDPEWRARQCA